VVGDRRFYFSRCLKAALDQLQRHAQFAAEQGGRLVGFMMARELLGQFGRAEPVAILDTTGVDPDYSHRGVGHGLLSQLFVNLEDLRVERVETVVARENFGLLGILYDIGFEPSRRLALAKRLT